MLVLPGETPVSKEIDHSEVHRMGRILEELYSGDLQPAENRNWDDPEYEAVSYTHLTLPTILRV